jgi:hypothetical protein
MYRGMNVSILQRNVAEPVYHFPATGPPPAASPFNDHTGGLLGEAANQPHINPPRLDTKRRQTLLSLLNALNELSQAESLGRGEPSVLCNPRLLVDFSTQTLIRIQALKVTEMAVSRIV